MTIQDKKFELKILNKELTKISNAIDKKLSSKTYALFNEINKEYRECSYYEKRPNGGGETIYEKPYLKEIGSLHYGSPDKILKWNEDSEAINMLKQEYPDFAKRLMDLYNAKVGFVHNYLEVKSQVDLLKEELEGGNKAQMLFKSMIKQEQNEKKIKAFNSFINSLKDWKPSEIIDDKIVVNGKELKENELVGVIVGLGDKIHPMRAEIAIDKDTNEKVIGLFNYTQWRKSELCIVDTMDNIPSEIIAYAKDETDELFNAEHTQKEVDEAMDVISKDKKSKIDFK
jgi:hypothetical protein